MKRLLLSTSIAALLLSSAAIAAPGHGHGKDKHRHARNENVQGHHDNGLHLGQRKQAWKRGQHIDRVYLAPRYYVTDYRSYQLAPPPRGYVWVRPYQDSNEYLLVQAATGIISQILGR